MPSKRARFACVFIDNEAAVADDSGDSDEYSTETGECCLIVPHQMQ
jgi:hypothetical protein